MVHLQLAQSFIIIILPEFKLVQGNEYTTLILTAKKLATLVGALREALAPTLLLEEVGKIKMKRQM